MISAAELQQKLEWVRDNFAKPINDYVDERDVRGDVTDAINKYAPDPWKDPLVEAVATLDELITAAAGGDDIVTATDPRGPRI